MLAGLQEAPSGTLQDTLGTGLGGCSRRCPKGNAGACPLGHWALGALGHSTEPGPGPLQPRSTAQRSAVASGRAPEFICGIDGAGLEELALELGWNWDGSELGRHLVPNHPLTVATPETRAAVLRGRGRP